MCSYCFLCVWQTSHLHSWFHQSAPDGRRESRGRLTENPLASLGERWGMTSVCLLYSWGLATDVSLNSNIKTNVKKWIRVSVVCKSIPLNQSDFWGFVFGITEHSMTKCLFTLLANIYSSICIICPIVCSNLFLPWLLKKMKHHMDIQYWFEFRLWTEWYRRHDTSTAVKKIDCLGQKWSYYNIRSQNDVSNQVFKSDFLY